jgi:hypothetical protein
MPQPVDGNSRVTVAILKEQLSQLRVSFESELRHVNATIERNHREVCDKIGVHESRSGETLDDHEDRLRALEGSQPWNLYRDLGVLIAAIGTGITSWLTNSK